MIQQFEGQVFEMLGLHKENIGEMAITGYLHEPNRDYALLGSQEDNPQSVNASDSGLESEKIRFMRLKG